LAGGLGQLDSVSVLLTCGGAEPLAKEHLTSGSNPGAMQKPAARKRLRSAMAGLLRHFGVSLLTDPPPRNYSALFIRRMPQKGTEIRLHARLHRYVGVGQSAKIIAEHAQYCDFASPRLKQLSLADLLELRHGNSN